MSHETSSTNKKAAFENCQYCSYSKCVCVIFRRNGNWNLLLGWNLDRTEIFKDEILKDNQNKNRETSCIISFAFRCVLLSKLIFGICSCDIQLIKLHFDRSHILLNILSILLNIIHWWNGIFTVQLFQFVIWVLGSIVKGRLHNSDEECSQQIRSHFFCFARFFFRFIHFIMFDRNFYRIHFLDSSRVTMNFLCHHIVCHVLVCVFLSLALFCAYRRYTIDERKKKIARGACLEWIRRIRMNRYKKNIKRERFLPLNRIRFRPISKTSHRLVLV